MGSENPDQFRALIHLNTTLEPSRQMLTDDDIMHWLALRLVSGLGMRKSVQLIEAMRSPQAIFRASKSELEGRGVSAAVAQSIASGCSFEDAVFQHERMKEIGAQLIPYTSPAYPDRLREIYDPPLVLFARGRIELLETLFLAIVGTRRPTTYGKVAAEKLAGDLASAGLTILSGMARGVDTSAHTAALKVGGYTAAVFGCGVDTVYPAENKRLAAEIAEKGLLLSEFPMRSPAYPQNFPVRNRIVSGMSIGVLVVEGAQYSGSSITARLALEQNRDVFAVPGNITSRMSWGPNLLIKQGAKLVQEWTDVVAELHTEHRRRLALEGRESLGMTNEETKGCHQPSLPLGPNGEVCRAVLAMLKVDSAVQIESLLETFEVYSSSEIIAALFELEMLGLVKQLPGKNFVKVWAGERRS
jgi:DNA processing protein